MRSSGSVPSTRTTAPSLADIEALASRALAGIPALFKRELGSVVIRVEELPDEATEAEMRLDSPFDLLGLYRGAPLPRRPDQPLDHATLHRLPE